MGKLTVKYSDKTVSIEIDDNNELIDLFNMLTAEPVTVKMKEFKASAEDFLKTKQEV